MKKKRGRTDPYPDEAVLGLELLGCVEVVVDETESGGLAASEMRAELEHEDAVGVLHVVHLGQLILELRLHRETQTMRSLDRHLNRLHVCDRCLALGTLALPGWITSST